MTEIENSSGYKVNVLMSTYNGEKYLKEQIDSILKQKNVIVKLYIRDDGSKDSTLHILDRYKEQYPDNIIIFSGDNIGFANSFMYLVHKCEHNDFYAFADQDDIWEQNKLEVAIKMIDQKIPLLYASNLQVFDTVENRNYLMYSLETFENEKVRMEKYCYLCNPYGCTMVWNEALQEEILKREKPDKQTHDIWINLIAHYTGKMILDPNSYINYRVHGNNACGATPKSVINKIKKYYKFYFIDKKSLHISLSCQSIEKYFRDKSDIYINVFANYKKNFLNKIKAINYVSKLHISKEARQKYNILILFNKF